MQVNHKRVLRMMRRDKLLALRRRRFMVTTNSNHKFEVYLNLARRMKLSGIDQLWVADITYIRLKAEFVYLAVILDAFSRKVVGWALDRTLANRLTISALEQAIAQRRPRSGLVHHSDRGLQYARGEYVALLEKFGIVASMSRPANPYDNASCESFMKTLKREEIYANRYEDLEHLRTNIEGFIEQYYNRQRLHSALGHRRRWQDPFSFVSTGTELLWVRDSRGSWCCITPAEQKLRHELSRSTAWSIPESVFGELLLRAGLLGRLIRARRADRVTPGAFKGLRAMAGINPARIL